MKDTVLNLGGTALVPELRTDITTCSSCDMHLVLVSVAALWTFPHELAVFFDYLNLTIVAADLAEVGLRVELGIEDSVVYVMHYGENCRDVVLHVRNLYIADCSARRQLLKVCFFGKLTECVNMLGYMDVITVGNVGMVCYAFDDAETALQTFCELVSRGFQRSSID